MIKTNFQKLVNRLYKEKLLENTKGYFYRGIIGQKPRSLESCQKPKQSPARMGMNEDHDISSGSQKESKKNKEDSGRYNNNYDRRDMRAGDMERNNFELHGEVVPNFS